MTYASRLDRQQPNAATRNVCASELPSKTPSAEHTTASRPSFASRMLQLVFQRRRRTADHRSKSWPGRTESLPVPTSASPPSSANIRIPHSFGSSSVPSTLPASRHVRARQERYRSDSQVNWRRRQAHCINCERLFPTFLSTVSGSAGRFCSLDCKANFEYVSHLQEALDVQMLMFDDTASSSSSSVADAVGDYGSDCGERT
ncbi:hypothetical protein PRIC2_009432 [Phytophthora ramorum]